jgi:hypothetical protein
MEKGMVQDLFLSNLNLNSIIIVQMEKREREHGAGVICLDQLNTLKMIQQ